VTALLILLLVIGGVVFRVLSPEERRRLLNVTIEALRELRGIRSRIKPCEPFRTHLRERTPRVFVAPLLLVLTVALFVAADVQALGNFGPSTTNGEWWRLLTATFVHAGTLHLLVNVIGLAPAAFLLERLVGHAALGGVFVAAGVMSGLVGLSANPVEMNVGASGAIFGVYGLLAATLAAGWLRRSPLTIPLLALKRLSPAAALFLLYNVGDGGFEASEMMGLATGLGCGGVLTSGLAERKPPIRRTAGTVAAMLVVAVASAASMSAIADVRPELARVLAIEKQTATSYASAVDGLRKGRLQPEALVKLIEDTIVPELAAVSERFAALEGVPSQQRPLVSHAEDYLRLRRESWRLRAEGLRTANMLRLRQAERTERESLAALGKIKPAG
jgi:rhomboid protease GluP